MFFKPILKTDERGATWGQIKAYRRRSGVVPYQMVLAIQLDHRFRSKWLLDKLHRLGYTESYTKTQNYKYCFLNDSNIVEISGSSDSPGVFDVATDEEIDDEMEVDFELGGLSAD